jgi:TIR domain
MAVRRREVQMDTDLEVKAEMVAMRAHDRLRHRFDEGRERLRAAAAAAGTLNSGGTVKSVERLAAETIASMGSDVISDLLKFFQAVYGTDIPLEVLGWTREMALRYVDGAVKGYTDRLAEERRRLNIPVEIRELGRAGQEARRDIDIELGKLELRARLMRPPTPPADASVAAYDVFICHAAEDKAEVGEPLAVALQQRGCRVWLDKFQLTIGDQLLQKIDEGLRSSRYGVVIMSSAFFAKQWPQWELAGLAAMQQAYGRKVILPVWHNMTFEQVRAHSLLMAAIYATPTSVGIECIADEISSVIKAA